MGRVGILVSWVPIYGAENAIQAHLIRSLLEADAIPVRLSGEALAGAVGELPTDVLQVEVLAPRGFWLRARGLVEAYADAPRYSEDGGE